MGQSLASKIEAANSALMGDGNLDAIAAFFAPDYVVHFTDEDMIGSHDAIRRVSGYVGVRSRISRLLLARKR